MFGSVGWRDRPKLYSAKKKSTCLNPICTSAHGAHEFFVEQDFRGVGSGMKNGAVCQSLPLFSQRPLAQFDLEISRRDQDLFPWLKIS